MRTEEKEKGDGACECANVVIFKDCLYALPTLRFLHSPPIDIACLSTNFPVSVKT